MDTSRSSTMAISTSSDLDVWTTEDTRNDLRNFVRVIALQKFHLYSFRQEDDWMSEEDTMSAAKQPRHPTPKLNERIMSSLSRRSKAAHLETGEELVSPPNTTIK